jgi:membrane protease YdiL (CAAX protease family)
MIWLEIAFLLVLAVVFPLLASRGFPAVMRAIALGQPGARRAAYRETMGWQWVLAAAGVAVWAAGDRTWADLGIRPPSGWGFWAAAAVAALVAAALTAQLRAVSARPERRAEVRTQLGGHNVLLPRTPDERAGFTAVSVTAGVCEELLYRGWMIGWLAPWLGVPAAAVTSLAVFGAAHSYAGRANALKATGLGALFTVLYLASGSLWVPIALHALIDINMGHLSTAAFRGSPLSPASGRL